MKTTRVQLDLPQERVREIDRLAEDCQIATRKEMFSAAMTLLFWAAK